ncbi:MAG: YaaA family protein [Candidatus Izemoplasma sp.]
MLILLAPSKTKELKLTTNLQATDPLFIKETNHLHKILKGFSKAELGKIMKIKNKLLDNAYSDILSFTSSCPGMAIESFNGLVYKGLAKDSYQEPEYNYLEKNLLILDAFYGIIKPSTLIKNYRLDFLMKLGINLYDYWNIDNYLNDEVIINLASKEFSKMIKSTKVITVSFLQNKHGKLINQATYSKQARGLFLNYLVINKIEDLVSITKFDLDNYKYNKSLSDEWNIKFTR